MATILSPILGRPLPTTPEELEDWCRIFDWRLNGYIITVQGAPPGSPDEGDAYIVQTGGVGLWDGLDGDVVIWGSDHWISFTPPKGLGPVWFGAGPSGPGWFGYDGTGWNDLFELEP
jgi:hypothetical protein